MSSVYTGEGKGRGKGISESSSVTTCFFMTTSTYFINVLKYKYISKYEYIFTHAIAGLIHVDKDVNNIRSSLKYNYSMINNNANIYFSLYFILLFNHVQYVMHPA